MALAKTDVLMLEDWGLAPLREGHRRDLRESVEDRHERRATLVLSQLPVEHWHEALGDPPLADALLDRLVHNAYKSTLQGESRRKRQARLTRGAITEEYSTAQRRCAPSLAGCAWRGGNLAVVHVAGFPWTGWQTSVEYAGVDLRQKLPCSCAKFEEFDTGPQYRETDVYPLNVPGQPGAVAVVNFFEQNFTRICLSP